jgi:hypothetical protein
MACHLIELVTMQEQEVTAVGGDVNMLVAHEDLAERDPVVLAQRFVVIARNQHDMLAVACATQNLLHDRILRRRPVDAPAHRPEVDDVADQVEILCLVPTEELQQTLGLTAAGAKMDVGNENRADLHRRRPGVPASAVARAGRIAGLLHGPPIFGVDSVARAPAQP